MLEMLFYYIQESGIVINLILKLGGANTGSGSMEKCDVQVA